MRKLGIFFILLISIFLFKPAVVNAEDYNKLGLVSARISTGSNFYSYVPSGTKTFYFAIDSDHIVLGHDSDSQYVVITSCNLTPTTFLVYGVSNIYGTTSTQGAYVYNSNSNCSFILSGTQYTGKYVYWVYPVLDSYFNMNDGTYNLVFNTSIYSGETGIYFLDAYAYGKVPDYILSGNDAFNQINNNNQNTQNIINNNNSNTNSINNTISNQTITISDDSINTTSSNSFFNNFYTSDNGGISSVITAPLSFVRAMTNSCSPISFTIFEQDISLPCGTTLFWDKEEVQPFRDVWNVLIGGAFVYMLLRKVFMTIEDMKDPESDKVSVIKL